jgi:hypothetical protein
MTALQRFDLWSMAGFANEHHGADDARRDGHELDGDRQTPFGKGAIELRLGGERVGDGGNDVTV